jgi:hypothetical protein
MNIKHQCNLAHLRFVLIVFLFIPTGVKPQDLVGCEERLTLGSLPPMGTVVRKALSELPVTKEEYKKWKQRIRVSTLLPRLDVRYGKSERNFYQYERVDPTRTIIVDNDVRWGDNYSFLFSWDLSRLVFHRDELQAAEIQRRLEDSRIKLIERITGYYSELQGSLVQLYNQDAKSNTILKLKPQTEKLMNLARLNALTNNFICKYVEQQTKHIQPNSRDTVPKHPPGTTREKQLLHLYEPPKNNNKKEPVFPYDEDALPSDEDILRFEEDDTLS